MTPCASWLRRWQRAFRPVRSDQGILANVIAPDVHETEMVRSLWDNPGVAEGYLKRNPSGRFGEPDEIAGTVVWLAAQAGGNINGQTIVVDGGYSIHYDWN